MVATPEGKLSHYFYGVNYSARDLRFGLIEASQHKIGSVAEQLSLYCYQYDPMTGKYGAAVMRVLRITGVVTLLGIVAMIFLLKPRKGQQIARGAEQ
jgi:protein SCO1/2